MRIVRAQAAGFCMGVRRAMNLVLEQARHGVKPVHTHGPLIHNPQVIEMLADMGVQVLRHDGAEASDREPRGTVVVRAHGITPAEHEQLEAQGYRVVDATCPHVIRIQKLIEKSVEKGRRVLIIGDPGHAEVEGLLGHARGCGEVLSSEEDIDRFLPEGSDPGEPVCVVSQTTQSAERFDRLVEAVRRRRPEATVHRTICGSTDRRQQETVRIARESDAMIVVGGRNSANTVRLAELAAETGTPTFHVEASDELKPADFLGKRRIGLTAGASTPNWMIAEVTERLREFGRERWSPPLRVAFKFLRFLIYTNLYLSLGAYSTFFACSVIWRGVGFNPVVAAVAALYIFAVYTLGMRTESQTVHFTDPIRWKFHQRYRLSLNAIGSAAIGVALLMAGFTGPLPFTLVAVGVGLGVLYRLSLVPERYAPFLRYRRLIDIPGSKDIFMGLAWAMMLSLLPWLAAHQPLRIADLAFDLQGLTAFAIVAFFVFTIVFTRSVLTDFRDIQTDQVVGRETIPIVLGKSRSKALLAVLTGLLLTAILIATRTGVLAPAGYAMVVPILYTLGYLYLYHRRFITEGVVFDAVLDASFLLTGLAALVWRLATNS